MESIYKEIDRLFTRDFFLVCIATALQGTSLSLVNTAMGPYLTTFDLGPVFVGGYLASFAFLALLARFPAGSLVGRFGARMVATIGVGLSSVAFVGYALAPLAPQTVAANLPLLIPVSLLAHGIGFSFYGTATFAFVGQTVAARRRGEGIGYYTVVMTLTQGVGAGASLAIVGQVGYQVLFLIAAAVGLCAAFVVAQIQLSGVTSRLAATTRSPIGTSVLAPAVACGTLTLAGGVAFSFVPLMGLQAGIGNPGIFFASSAAAGILVRIFGGRIADRYNRMVVILPGVALLNLGLFAVGSVTSVSGLIAAGAVFGIGLAAAQPSMQAMIVDRVSKERQGAASATLWIMQDAGVITGAFAAGFLVSAIGYENTFRLTGIPAIIGTIIIFLFMRSLSRRS
jgi:MFS family permease